MAKHSYGFIDGGFPMCKIRPFMKSHFFYTQHIESTVIANE